MKGKPLSSVTSVYDVPLGTDVLADLGGLPRPADNVHYVK
jgi:hypothetical protein